jgi:hypothetical protein
MAFQVTSPYSNRRVLMPHALVMHVNPQNYSEQHNKKVERIQTRGGWVEQHWGDDLTEITCDGSTGAFMNIYTGLTALLRQRTIQWDRYRDLHDLFRNNGSLYDPYGNIVLQGAIMLMYDRGTYNGYFKTFEVEETDDSPFAFRLSWTFKVQEELLKLPNLGANPNQRGIVSPLFQSQNAVTSQFANPGAAGGSTDPATNLANINNATFTQQMSSLNAVLSQSQQGAGEVNEGINQYVNNANTAAQQGDYSTAFQNIRAAQGLAAGLSPLTNDHDVPFPGLPTRQGGT